jgi:hypothetical protein
MRQKSESQRPSAERIVKDIRRATRKQYSAEEKIRIVLDGLRGEHSMRSCAGARALPRASTTIGRKSSWKPASDGWPGIPRVRRPAARSGICDRKPGR